MGKKYIIELLDECNSEFKGIMVFGLTQEKQISVELIPEESLRPYTEPDMEQVRKDAWEAVRKIVALSTVDRRKVFGSEYMYSILEKHTASEAIEKLKAYEQEQNEIIDPDKNKVEALANDIGIHKLYAFVKEIRGE